MKKLLYLMVVVAFIAALVVTACGVTDRTTYQVKYEVTGTAQSASLTYQNKDGGTSQESDVVLPWTYSFEGESGDFVYISAQNSGETGSVITTIYRDGDVFKTSTSTGAYVIASASGSL